MSTEIRENNIRNIIALEDRISQCRRCQSLVRCTAKPALGKGELEPDIMLIFESENSFTRNKENILRLRKLIKNEFDNDKIYHTFMIRCNAKSCTRRDSIEIYLSNKLLDVNNSCVLTGKKCDGILVKASDEAAVYCLPYLIEEIEIFKPSTVILFGSKVSEYILKAYGMYDKEESKLIYKYDDKTFLKSSDEFNFGIEECRLLSELS